MKGNLATVSKSGKIMNIAEDDLRKGDMVVLQTGDLVPADLKLVEASGLELDEFELTRNHAGGKKVNGRDVFVYKGSRVIKGNAKGIVVHSFI